MPTDNSESPRPPVEIETDVGRKIVRLHFRGVVRASDLRVQARNLRDRITQVGREFSLLTDLSELQEMEIDSASEIAKLMDWCLAAGVKEIVRIIPDPDRDIGFHLLSMTHYRGRVPITTCHTRAEAERSLTGRPAQR